MSQKQQKLQGFSDAQLEEIDEAIEGYSRAEDALKAANVQLKNDVANATEALVEVMRKYKRTQIVLEGRLVQIFDLVKVKVTGRKARKDEAP
jgi:hypothetical protein